MNEELGFLVSTAATIGVLHTLLGPDHYVPFVAMARAGSWSRMRTIAVTAICGVGHVLGSVVLGALGVVFGLSLSGLTEIESTRGEVAGWLLIAFGLVYAVWGMRKALRSKVHCHMHSHGDGVTHSHDHNHAHDHAHLHEDGSASTMTPWVLFVIFAFGPCEALIPLLMYPAAKIDLTAILLVVIVFGVATIATMLTVVSVLLAGVQQVKFEGLSRYSHALAGSALVICGAGMQFLGL